MRKHPSHKIEKYRITNGLYTSTRSNGNNGAFDIPTKKGTLWIIISDQLLWDHVSVSLKSRIPTWKEMCFVKNLFWEPEETVIQYHPAESKYINQCPFVLHLWKPQGIQIPMPPIEFV